MNTIDQLAAALEAAKIAEDAAKDARIDAENALLAVLPERTEGSATERGRDYKATVTYGMTRSLDAAALAAIKDRVPEALFEQAIEYAPKLKLAGLRFLQNNEPEAYAVLAQAITAKPSKPSVKVEALVSMREAA